MISKRELSNILKGLVRYPLYPNFLYPKGIMKGPFSRGGGYIKWNGPLLIKEFDP